MSERTEKKAVELVPVFDITSQFADGYHDGKICRKDAGELSWELRVGVDDYARGFRTGYNMQA